MTTELLERQTRADERALLGAALIDPTVALHVVALLPAQDCLQPEHRALLEWLAERARQRKSLDLLDLTAEIDPVRAQRMGGLAYLVELPNASVSSAIDVTAIAGRLRARAALRTIGDLASVMGRAAAGERALYAGAELPREPADLASAVATRLLAVSQPARRVEWTLGDAADESAWERLTARERGERRTVTTGAVEADDLLDGGLRCGELVVVAGRPGAGKTAYALSLALEAAQADVRVGVVSLEMSAPELADRVLARASGLELGRIRRGELDAEEVVSDWRVALGHLPLRIATPSSITVEGIVSQAHRWAAKGLDLLVIDYLQLVRHGRADRHDLSVGATATACKTLARDLRIPVVLLSQLNREVEKRGGKPKEGTGRWWLDVELPRLSDLRDSGQIEQDADVVLFPVRAEQFGLSLPGAAALVVAKNRNGRVGVVPMRWDGPTASYAGCS